MPVSKFQLLARRLLGDKWADQELQPRDESNPGDPTDVNMRLPYPEQYKWPWKILPDQIDAIRDGINTVLEYASELDVGANFSSGDPVPAGISFELSGQAWCNASDAEKTIPSGTSTAEMEAAGFVRPWALNLAATTTAEAVTIVNPSGNNAIIPLANDTKAGVISPEQFDTLEEKFPALQTLVDLNTLALAADDVDFDTAQERLEELKRVAGLVGAIGIAQVGGLQGYLNALQSGIDGRENSGVAATLDIALESSLRGSNAATETLTQLRADITGIDGLISTINMVLSADDVDLDTAQERLTELKRLAGLIGSLGIAQIDGLQEVIGGLQAAVNENESDADNAIDLVQSNLDNEAEARALVDDSHESRLDDLNLEAITATIAATAVDTFIYDIERDIDGGAWRHRTQEDIPSSLVLMAESSSLTALNLDDPATPAWKVYDFTGSVISSVSAKNAEIVIGTNSGVTVINMITGVVDTYTASSFKSIVSNAVNDTALTVLPDAPIDHKTGLPVVTKVVATDGNGTYSVSLLTHDGVVFDIASDSTGAAVSVSFNGPTLTVVRSDGTVYVWNDVGTITADGVAPDATYTSVSTPALLGTVSDVANSVAFGSPAGMTILTDNPATPANGMTAVIDADSTSGHMVGDIKGAWLADTDTSLLVGGELVTNGDFADGANWATTASIASGKVAFSASGQNCDQDIAELSQGLSYVVTLDILDYVSGGLGIGIGDFSTIDASVSGNGAVSFHGVAGVGSVFRLRSSSSTSFSIDNISVKLADTDRSHNANGLAVTGSIDRTEVSAGAELVKYSGTGTLSITDASISDTDYAYCWVEVTANNWELQHGLLSTNPISGVTITGNTLDVNVTLPKSLLRVTGTTPSNYQLIKIDDDEIKLFQVDTKCVLFGTSDDVKAIAHDSGTGLVHAGLIAGRSDFDGLVRVANTTIPVTTSIAAQNGLVVSQ